jgi:2,3,4,5-tetrahydropyridine-2-carboxylate N-succinyltransferase
MTAVALSRTPAIDHLVLVRAFHEDRLVAVLPNLPAPPGAGREALTSQSDALRLVHGLQDRDGTIHAQAAKDGLAALAKLGQEAAPAGGLLKRALGAQPVKLASVASPVPGLLARLAQRKGSAADTLAFADLLNAGDVRAAEKVDGAWQPQAYVIDGILNFFAAHGNGRIDGQWWDKVPQKTQGWSDAEFAAAGVRFAPGSRVRTGCYIGPGTVVMNHAYVNMGAYIAGQGVMVDVSARIASCAQIGKNVKFGAGSGIEGVLEPAGRLPSIVEDHAKVGAMCEVSGILGEGSVLASGVVMASGKRVYDEGTGKVIPNLELAVGGVTYQIPVIPPYRLAVGGSLLSEGGRTATDAVILKPGDLRDRDTLKHFEKQGILYR